MKGFLDDIPRIDLPGKRRKPEKPEKKVEAIIWHIIKCPDCGSTKYPVYKTESAATDEIAVSGEGSEEQTEPSPEDKAIMSLIEGSHFDIANRLCVPCPNNNGRAVLFSFCEEGCQERQDCPTFEEYDKK